jgi:hypothetical protein
MKRVHVLTLAITVATLLPAVAAALNMPGPIVPCHGLDCNCNNLIQVAQNVLFTGIYLAVFLSAVLFAWAGWKLLTAKSMGDSHGIEGAKKILWNVIIGLVIILAAWLIVNTLFTALTSSKGLGSFCPQG